MDAPNSVRRSIPRDLKRIVVIGMGLSADDLTAVHLKIIRSADLLMGGRRNLAPFESLSGEKYAITGNVAQAIAVIRARKEAQRIVILASGDPLLFGIGANISREFGEDAVSVLPNISSVAAAFARIHEPWDGARTISLHGRDRQFELLAAVKQSPTVAVLTDLQQSPEWLAGWLLERGVDRVRMAVFERLGAPEETCGWYDLRSAAGRTFVRPNLVVLKREAREHPSGDLHPGMADDAFDHENGLITKSEVRAVALAKLQLRPGQTLWDLGAGSGSVGLEASASLGSGRVIAVEQSAGRIARIRANARRYGVYNHETVQATLPEGLSALAPPDRIFVGGGGRGLALVVRKAAGYLAPGGILVVNTVLVDNISPVLAEMACAEMTVELVQIQVSRSKAMPWSMRLEAHNPVWIVTGKKVEKESP